MEPVDPGTRGRPTGGGRVSAHGSIRPDDRITRVGPSRSRTAPLLAVLIAAIATAEIVAGYLPLQGRLPPRVAVHFGLSGAPDGWLPPALALLSEVVTVVALSAVFVVLQAWIARSAPLTAQFRGRIARPLLVFQAVLVAGIIPAVSTLEFASAAGVIAISGRPLGILFLEIGLLSAAAILVVAGLTTGRPTPRVGGPTPATRGYRARFAVGGPIELRCPACGEQYWLNGVPVFAPHLGVGRFGSLYLRCRRCGERGWNAVVARAGG